jgi:uncharacterized hydrophobic protein (TIGR00271 family)
MSRLTGLVRENRFTPEIVPWFEGKLFYEGDRRRPYLEQFWMLLVLSTIIATAGVIGDSTATVIGAMIVAPLMTPIMAVAAALVTGQVPRAVRSLGLVLLGVAAVVGLSWLIGAIYPGFISFDTNSQITGRTSPRLIDLVAALASGAAGAFCMSREDVSDSLPGVAIAISLVPPLCVVGLSLADGHPDDAAGAMLLFTANALAILLAGGGLLVLLGLSAARTEDLRGHARRNAFVAIVIAVIAVSVPLAASGLRVGVEARSEQQAAAAASSWASSVGFTLRTVVVDGDQVRVTVTGPGINPPVASLQAAMSAALGRSVGVQLETIPSTIQVAGP